MLPSKMSSLKDKLAAQAHEATVKPAEVEVEKKVEIKVKLKK